MISARGIHKRFDNLEVIRGVDLDIAEGEVVAIVGPSGAGKSTLLQIIGSLDRPDSGTVKYSGTDIYTMREKQLARFRGEHIGFVFQFHQLLPEFTLEENVAMPALIAGHSRSESFERAAALIDRLGLSERRGHRPGQLSGGERQRAAVARALVNRPDVVLADEPSGSLDTANRTALHRLFFELRDELGCTFVIVTHDTSLATDADRIISLRDGLIVN